MIDRIEFLRRSELFAGVPEPLLARVDASLTEVRLAADAVLFHEGEIGDAVYLVVSGALALEAEGVRILRRRPGECVGEFALIDDEPRSATALAQTDATLLRWSRADFQSTLASDPGVARGIFRMLTGKLRQDVVRTIDMEVEKERWRQDIARAREIQLGMLPASRLAAPALEVAGYCTPATEVGGDYYDYLLFDDARVGLVIADVTGHGFYSGLFVAMAKSCLHTQARFDYSPARIMDAMRRALDLSIQRRLLMTCCYVLFDAERGRLAYANAGHPPPYHYRPASGELTALEALDPLLGVLGVDAGDFEAREHGWRPGDVLVLYSDGVTETRDADGEEFGAGRLEAAIRDLGDAEPAAIEAGILERLAAHAGPHPRGDDTTLVVARAR